MSWRQVRIPQAQVSVDYDKAALFGVTPAHVTESLETLFAGIARQPDTGVVLLQEEIYDGLPEDVRGRLDRSARPFVVPFPGPVWEKVAPAEERVIELLRRAIGYRVRLQ